MIQQESQKPIYALAENLDKNPDQTGNVGPDESTKGSDQGPRQGAVSEIPERRWSRPSGFEDQAPVENQTVVDAFGPIIDLNGKLSRETIELLSDAIAKFRKPNTNLEVIVWANMPSKDALQRKLKVSERLRGEVEKGLLAQPDAANANQVSSQALALFRCKAANDFRRVTQRTSQSNVN